MPIELDLAFPDEEARVAGTQTLHLVGEGPQFGGTPTPDEHSVQATDADRLPARILIVDDSEANLLEFESILGDLGGNLVRARSGQEALSALLSQEFALVLLDVRMPDMDGFELAQLIREKKRQKNLQIIFVTALAPRGEDLDRAYELGAVDFIAKPISATVLRAKARVFIELHRSRMDLERRVAERTIQLEKEVLERRRSEEALRASEERERTRAAELQVIMESVPAAIWITKDREAKVIVGNRRSYEIVRMVPGQNVSRSALEGEASLPYEI
jgi:CheY-like chemotaxis protein